MRRLLRLLDSLLDSEDRQMLAELFVLLVAVAIGLILLAAVGGIAVAVFEEMRSI